MIIQGTVEWHKARLGRVTASRVADLCAKTKSGWSTSRANYMAELICERLTGNPTPTFQNDAMRHGTEQEPFARQAYEQCYGVEVLQTGFVEHPEIDMSGCSPDGYVTENGLIEVKCPYTATHLDTLLNGAIPDKYITQMQWQMACTGREWCDYVSYDPRLPENMCLFVKRIPRSALTILELESAVADFLAELEGKMTALDRKYPQAKLEQVL